LSVSASDLASLKASLKAEYAREIFATESKKRKGELSMKSRIALSVLSVLIAAPAFASDATTAFEKLKTLQGSWAGKAPDGRAVQISNRLTSGGSVLMSEVQGPENMVTMIHLDGDRLMLTHYCAMGNQPRMVGTISPDGQTITFDFLDATNLSSRDGHLQRIVFNLVDSDHHTENWEFKMADGKQTNDSIDLKRTK
jgi:hypothetical protein